MTLNFFLNVSFFILQCRGHGIMQLYTTNNVQLCILIKQTKNKYGHGWSGGRHWLLTDCDIEKRTNTKHHDVWCERLCFGIQILLMASRFNIYFDLVISRNELLISTIQLLISTIHLMISAVHLVISPIQLLISTIHLVISPIQRIVD